MVGAAVVVTLALSQQCRLPGSAGHGTRNICSPAEEEGEGLYEASSEVGGRWSDESVAVSCAEY